MSQGTEVPKALDANICKARRLERVKQWEMAALVMFDKILSRKSKTFVVPPPEAAPPAAVVDPTAEVTISQENGRPVTFSIPVMPEKAPIHVKLSISSFKDLRLKAENGHINISYDVSGQEENTAAVASSNIAGNAAAASKAGSNQKAANVSKQVPPNKSQPLPAKGAAEAPPPSVGSKRGTPSPLPAGANRAANRMLGGGLKSVAAPYIPQQAPLPPPPPTHLSYMPSVGHMVINQELSGYAPPPPPMMASGAIYQSPPGYFPNQQHY